MPKKMGYTSGGGVKTRAPGKSMPNKSATGTKARDSSDSSKSTKKGMSY